MKTLTTSQYVLEQIENNRYTVFKRQYDIGTTTAYCEIDLHEEVVKGLEKNPNSGYWGNVICQCVNQHGKLYEKYKV